MTAQPTGTVTFLFTDIEGSTKRWERLHDAMAEAVARHDRLLRAAIEARGGYVVKTVGDAFCAAFPTADGALAAALAAQRALAGEDWTTVDGLRVRMALHAGVAEEHNTDYLGPTVDVYRNGARRLTRRRSRARAPRQQAMRRGRRPAPVRAA